MPNHTNCIYKFNLSPSFGITVLLAIFSPFIIHAQLTGVWKDDGGSTYQVRQVGNQIFWTVDASPRVVNVFHGIIAGDIITGRWADVPGGENRGSGSLALKVENPNRMVKLASNGNYGASVWTRDGTSPVTGGTEPTAPVTLPQPVAPSSTTNAIKIPGAVDIAVSSTDIWVGHGEWGIYKIPLSTRSPQSFSSDKMVKFITVDQNNRPWIIDTENNVYYHNGSSWINTNSSQCKDICIDRHNRAWVIDYGWWLKYYDMASGKWVRVEKNDGRALGVIDENNIVHANFYQNVHFKQNGKWKAIPGLLMDDLAMSPNRKIWGKGNDGKVHEWVNGKWEERVEYGKAKRIALSPSGEAYTIKVEEN